MSLCVSTGFQCACLAFFRSAVAPGTGRARALNGAKIDAALAVEGFVGTLTPGASTFALAVMLLRLLRIFTTRGHFAPLLCRPPWLIRLAAARDSQRIGRHIVGNHRSRGNVGPISNSHRSH